MITNLISPDAERFALAVMRPFPRDGVGRYQLRLCVHKGRARRDRGSEAMTTTWPPLEPVRLCLRDSACFGFMLALTSTRVQTH